MNLNRVLGVLVVALLLGAAGLWVRSHLEVKQVKRVIPPAAYVKADSYYALAHILAPTLKVQRYVDVAKIGLTNTALVVVDARSLDKLNEARLTDWIARGGLLMVTFSGPTELPRATWWKGGGPFEGLAPHFGLPVSRTQRSEQRPSKSTSKRSVRSSSSEKRLVVLVDTTVSFPAALKEQHTEVIQYHGSTNLAVRSWGKGKLIVCGAPFFLVNRNLEKRDDLRFTNSIFGGLMSHPGELVWLPRPPAPSVASSSQVDTEPLTIAILVVFFLLVWMKAPRFGPVLPEPAEDSRSLRMRFRAEGRFLWRNRAGGWIVDRIQSVGSVHARAERDPTHEERTATRSEKGSRHPSRRGFIDVVVQVAHDVNRSYGKDRRRAAR